MERVASKREESRCDHTESDRRPSPSGDQRNTRVRTRKIDVRSEGVLSRVSVTQTAKYFSVDAATIRRWLRAGCPCVRRGRRGPGHGALLDLQQVAQWRGNPNRPGELTVDPVLSRIAAALCATLMTERADLRAGIDRESAAAVLVAAFERCCREFGKTYRFDQLPQPIRTLMHEL